MDVYDHEIRLVEALDENYSFTFPELVYMLRDQSCSREALATEMRNIVSYQLIDAVHHLHSLGITIGNLSHDSVRYDPMAGKIQVVGYGIHTRFHDVSRLSVHDPFYSVLDGSARHNDIWALGMLLYQLYSMELVPTWMGSEIIPSTNQLQVFWTDFNYALAIHARDDLQCIVKTIFESHNLDNFELQALLVSPIFGPVNKTERDIGIPPSVFWELWRVFEESNNASITKWHSGTLVLESKLDLAEILSQCPLSIDQTIILHYLKILQHGQSKDFGPLRQLVVRHPVPSPLRPLVWKTILDISPKAFDSYRNYRDALVSLDRDEILERQLDLDLPRCCPQDPDMKSVRVLHENVLRLFLSRNRHWFQYWQGLDSLVVPLIKVLQDELVVYNCLEALAFKVLAPLFCNHQIKTGDVNLDSMRILLNTLQRLMVFHDPEFGMFLQDTGLDPEYYAMPWLLTMFTHLFPLDKVLMIWDHMLSLGYELPVFLCLALLIQLRDDIMNIRYAKDRGTRFHHAISVVSGRKGRYQAEAALGLAQILMNSTPVGLVFGSNYVENPSSLLMLDLAEFPQPRSWVVIDTRPFYLFAKGHLHGSISIDLPAELGNEIGFLRTILDKTTQSTALWGPGILELYKLLVFAKIKKLFGLDEACASTQSWCSTCRPIPMFESARIWKCEHAKLPNFSV